MKTFFAFLCGMSGAFLGDLVSDLMGGMPGVQLFLSAAFAVILVLLKIFLTEVQK